MTHLTVFTTLDGVLTVEFNSGFTVKLPMCPGIPAADASTRLRRLCAVIDQHAEDEAIRAAGGVCYLERKSDGSNSR